MYQSCEDVECSGLIYLLRQEYRYTTSQLYVTMEHTILLLCESCKKYTQIHISFRRDFKSFKLDTASDLISSSFKLT